MSVFAPPPTYAQVLLTDPSSGEVKFNPIWLDWFIQLSNLLTDSSGNAGTSFLSVPPWPQFGTLAQQNADFVTLGGLTQYQQITLPPPPPTGYRQFSGSLTLTVNAAVHQVPDGILNIQVMDSIAALNGYVGRRASGSFAAKTGVLLGETIAAFHGLGYGATTYGTTYQGSIQINAAENFTDGAKGSYIKFSTTLIGTAATLEAMRILDNGDVSLGGGDPASTESLHVYKVIGGTRWIKVTGSVAGNPTLDVSGGKLACAATLVLSKATLVETSVALTNGAAAAAGTLLNAPVAGDPTKWFPINDNGTVRYVPSW